MAVARDAGKASPIAWQGEPLGLDYHRYPTYWEQAMGSRVCRVYDCPKATLQPDNKSRVVGVPLPCVDMTNRVIYAQFAQG